MMTKRNFGILLTAALILAAIGTTAWADPKPKPVEPSLIGTWNGADMSAEPDLAWLAVHTPGSNGTDSGDMVMDWVYVNPDVIGGTEIATRLSPGHGVWKKTGVGQYAFTWYAYGLNTNTSGVVQPMTAVRVRGVATNIDNDHVSISYYFEFFGTAVPPHQMDTAGVTPMYTTTGSAEQWRAPLVTP